MRDGLLVVAERYGRSRSLFTLDGVFQKKEACEPRLHYLADGTRFEPLHFEEAFRNRMVLKNLETGHLLGKLEDDTGIGFHLSQSWPVRLDKDHTLIVKPRGAFEIYNKEGQLVSKREVPLALFKKEVERDPFGDAILKHRPRKIKYYRFGLPLFDVAVESPEIIWFLAGDERSITEDERKPTEVTLFRINLKTGKISLKTKLPIILRTISIEDDHLVLLSQQDAVIQVYALAQIRTTLGE
ncbi:MAG: hypothetical protein QNK37_04650 [Acidobacteriota bacterium]|nr:hypothetical protein [Acidobacteriota bacterium]